MQFQLTMRAATAWRNAEFRSYTFTADSDDDNPTLVETEESFRRRCGENASRPTDADQTRMAAIAKARLAQELADIGKHRDAIRRAVAEAALAKERGASD